MAVSSAIPSPLTAAPPAGIWQLDPVHTMVEFVARHLLTKVRGRFHEFEGTITIDPQPERSSVNVTIKAASLDTKTGDRDQHLRSADFLDVENHPSITFRSKAVELTGSQSGKVRGDLTIRGVTRPVTLDAEYLGWSVDPWGGKRAAFSASTTINREDFGAKWNMVLEAGGLLVSKDVRIELEVEAVLQAV